MPRVDIVDLKNQKSGELELADEVFAVEVNEALLYESVRHHEAERRSGTAKTKTRHEVSGSGKKLWRQKGTGRARMGSVRSPIWRHGGTVHGPVPRDYTKDVSPREKRNALKSALSRKLKEAQVIVLESLEVPTHRTKELVTLLSRLGADGRVLLVDRFDNENLELAARNNTRVKTV